MEITIDSAGLLAGLIFIFLNIKASRTLLGSFFKTHYRARIAASIVFTIGWINELLPKFNLIDAEMAESWHHIFLLAAGVLFVIGTLYMPKEADKLMKPQEKAM